MLHRWLLLNIVWIGCHLANGEPQEIIENAESIDPNILPFPYFSYFSIGSPKSEENFNEMSADNMENDDIPYANGEGLRTKELQRKQQYTDQFSKDGNSRKKRWIPDFENDSMQNKYYPFVSSVLNNSEGTVKEKRSFSPWGGKRGQPLINQGWSSERGFLRESSMPKRVRFSPWGGKRSGNFKPAPQTGHYIQRGRVDNKDPRTKIVSTYAGFVNDFGPPRQYKDLYLKKDGKRKVKFSTWGGKRSSPIIDSIQSPQTVKEFLDSILLITGSNSDPAAAVATNQYTI